MNVAYVRPEVSGMVDTWKMIRDCIEGERAVKAKGDKYLPRPNPTDTTEANKTRYEQYLARAVFYNVTKRTHAGLVGEVFSREPVVKLPTIMEPIETDADGCGVPLAQQAQKTLGEVVGYGRCGLLVDYPDVEEPASRADLLAARIRPTIILYEPWSVINWRTTTIGAQIVLSLVVIAESFVEEDDGFEIKTKPQWRVLRLDKETGFYKVEIWRLDNGIYTFFNQYFPKDANGENLKYIPFTFVGSTNNDTTIDLPPMYDLASLNIAHYRNSADYEEACYICGQPTPVLAGLTKDWVKDVLKGAVHLGSRAAIPLPVGGAAELLQAAPNSMPKEAMEAKERQMVALGARLVEQREVQRTLGEAQMEEASEASVLSTCAKNVVSAYRLCLQWVQDFLGDSGTLEFELNTNFDVGHMTPDEQRALIADWQAGAISFTEMRFKMKMASIAFQDDEEAKAEIEAEMASGMGAGALALQGGGKSGNNPSGGDQGNQ